MSRYLMSVAGDAGNYPVELPLRMEGWRPGGPRPAHYCTDLYAEVCKCHLASEASPDAPMECCVEHACCSGETSDCRTVWQPYGPDRDLAGVLLDPLARRAELLAELARLVGDPGDGTLGIVVDERLAADPAVTAAQLAEVWREAERDAATERAREQEDAPEEAPRACPHPVYETDSSATGQSRCVECGEIRDTEVLLARAEEEEAPCTTM